MKKEKQKLRKKFKNFFTFYAFISFTIVISFMLSSYTISKYLSTVSAQTTTQISIAKPILTLDGEFEIVDVVLNTPVTRYFSVMNYDGDETTDVGLDYYIYLTDDEDNVVTNATIYFQNSASDPNEYEQLPLISEGEFTGYFSTSGFTTTRARHNYKLVIDSIDKERIKIKVKAIQKRVEG